MLEMNTKQKELNISCHSREEKEINESAARLRLRNVRQRRIGAAVCIEVFRRRAPVVGKIFSYEKDFNVRSVTNLTESGQESTIQERGKVIEQSTQQGKCWKPMSAHRGEERQPGTGTRNQGGIYACGWLAGWPGGRGSSRCR